MSPFSTGPSFNSGPPTKTPFTRWMMFPRYVTSYMLGIKVNKRLFQDRIAPPFPPAPRTPATTAEFQPPYFPPPFAPHGMLQAPTVQAEVFSSTMQPLNSADPYQVTSTLHHFQTQQVGSKESWNL